MVDDKVRLEMSYKDCDKYTESDCYNCTAQDACAFWLRLTTIFRARCKKCGNLMPEDELSSLLPLCPDCENIETTLEMENSKSLMELERGPGEPLR